MGDKTLSKKNSKYSSLSKYSNNLAKDNWLGESDVTVRSDLLPEVFYVLKCENCDENVETYTKPGCKTSSIICFIFW